MGKLKIGGEMKTCQHYYICDPDGALDDILKATCRYCGKTKKLANTWEAVEKKHSFSLFGRNDILLDWGVHTETASRTRQ